MSKCKKDKPCLGVLEIHRHDAFLSGLIIANTVNLKTGETRKRIAYKPQKQSPIYLNFCPWCGVDQNFKKKPRTKTRTSK